MKHNLKQKFILKILFGIILVAVLVYVYIYSFNKLLNKSQLIADRQASIDNQIIKSQQSLDNKKQADTIAKISGDIDQHFLKSQDVPAFLSQIESLGPKAGSIIKISSVEEVSVPDVGIVLVLNISSSGPYDAVYKNIVELENLPYLSIVDRMALSAGGFVDSQDPLVKKTSATMNVTLTIKSYLK